MTLPFDAVKLDRLLEEAGADLLLAVTKHNIQYLLGGYRYFFFAHGDAIATCRYLPIVGYFPGHPEQAFYVGAANEACKERQGVAGHLLSPGLRPARGGNSASGNQFGSCS